MAVNLSKNETVNLSQESKGLTKVILGTSWLGIPNVATKAAGFFGKMFGKELSDKQVLYETVDVDSFVMLLDGKRKLLDTVSYGHLHDKYGAIQHFGDDRTGKDKQGKFDNEEIDIDLMKLPEAVKYVVLAANVFGCSHRFDEIEGCYTRVLKAETREELVHYALDKASKGNYAIIIGELERENYDWIYRAVGQSTNHRSIQDVEYSYR